MPAEDMRQMELLNRRAEKADEPREGPARVTAQAAAQQADHLTGGDAAGAGRVQCSFGFTFIYSLS